MYKTAEDFKNLAVDEFTFILGRKHNGKTYSLRHNKQFSKAETRFIKKTIKSLERALLKVRFKLCMAQYNVIKSTINILKESIGED